MGISQFIYSWLKDLVILFVIITLIDLIMPKGSIKRYMNFVIGLLIIFTVINPFVNIGKIKFDLDKEVLKNSEITVPASSIDIIDKDLLIEEQQQQIEKVYKEKIIKEINRIIDEDDKYEVYDIDIKIDKSENNFGYIETVNITLYENNHTKDKKNINVKINPINPKNSEELEKNTKEFSQLKNLIFRQLGIDLENISIQLKG